MAPDELTWPTEGAEIASVKDFVETLADHRLIGTDQLACLFEVGRSAGKVNTLQGRIFRRHIAVDAMRDVKHAKFQKTHDFPAFEAEFGDRVNLCLDFPAGGFGHVAAIKWLLKIVIIRQVGPGADCLDLDILDLGGGRCCHAQSHSTRNGCGRSYFVSGFQHYEISLLSIY